MPAAKLKWNEEVLPLFMTGANCTEIGKHLAGALGGSADTWFNTLEKHAKRHNWYEIREKAQKALKTNPGAKEGLSGISTGVQLAADMLASHRREFLEAGGKVAVTGMKKVAQQIDGEENIFTIGQLGEIAESFTRIAKPVFGLDSANVSVNLATQVNILSDLPPETLDWDAK